MIHCVRLNQTHHSVAMDKDTKIEPRVWPTRGSNVRRRCSFVLQIDDNHYALHFALAFVASCAVNALVKPFANEVRNDVPHDGCSDSYCEECSHEIHLLSTGRDE